MSKYLQVIQDIEGVFATSSWTNENITVYPANYSGAYTNEFVKIEVVPSKPFDNYSKLNVQGQAIAQIYVQTGLGSRRIMEIADKLDNILQAKT